MSQPGDTLDAIPYSLRNEDYWYEKAPIRDESLAPILYIKTGLDRRTLERLAVKFDFNLANFKVVSTIEGIDFGIVITMEQGQVLSADIISIRPEHISFLVYDTFTHWYHSFYCTKKGQVKCWEAVDMYFRLSRLANTLPIDYYVGARDRGMEGYYGDY